VVSSLTGAPRGGTHDSTGARPRTTSGVIGPTANVRRPRGSTRPPGSSATSARLSQPLSARAGPASPLVEAVEVLHRRIEGEEAVERQRRRIAVELEGVVAAQLDPVGIADRRYRGKPVQRAPQHDGEEARVAAFRARNARHIGPGEQRARAEQQFAAGRGVRVHDHLHWNSGAISTRVSACGLLSARATARRVSSDASGPSAVSSIAAASSRSPLRWAKMLAMSSR